jgi:hypothetical protein
LSRKVDGCKPLVGGGAPGYDVVHLSARNARLEEKLSKALAKNRSMAKYYDQLLVGWCRLTQADPSLTPG